MVIYGSDWLSAVAVSCLRLGLVVRSGSLQYEMVDCVRERLFALAVSCLRYGVVVCGNEWLSAVESGSQRPEW